MGARTDTPWRVEAILDAVGLVSAAKDGLGGENLGRLLLRFPWSSWMARHSRITIGSSLGRARAVNYLTSRENN